jgi:DNA-binding transcriptional ArsR family regulator
MQKSPAPSAFRTPWNWVLGAESHVRALRALERAREPMSVRELARRCRMQHRAMLLAIERLEPTGVVERVGSGRSRQVRLAEHHPLAPALQALFRAERDRVDRVLEALRQAARTEGQGALAVWLEGPVAEGTDEPGTPIVLGVLAPAPRVSAIADALRASVLDLMRRENVLVEVRGWTHADLEALAAERAAALATAIPVLGAPPRPAPDPSEGRRRPRSHAVADAHLAQRARGVAAALRRRPELVALAREEIARRLTQAPPHEARTLREWQQVLESMTPLQLRRWLVDSGEQPTRLRQSLPLAFLKAADEAS